MKRFVVTLALLGLACAGCQQSMKRLNAPPHGHAERTSAMQAMYEHMVDNALLQDMVISDVHFVPHRAQLNTLGEQRLGRLATLMETYGGTIRFSSETPDADLRAARTTAIVTFLEEAGLDTTTEVVKADLPGGRGMDAGEAILIKANEGTYKPNRKSAGARGSMTIGGQN